MPVLSRLESTVTEAMARWSVPGIAIGLLHQGQVEMSGYGIASVETVQPVVPETLFQIGSISKVFTTALVMTLVDEGRLELDEPVITYLPDLTLADPAAREGVTLRHLLTHTGGFVGDRFDDHGPGDDALARAIAALGTLRQQTPLGETWTYCNAGFDIAGRCVEVVLGLPFETAMRERVFLPLGLERATYFAAEAIRYPVAVGHLEDAEEGWVVADPWPIPRRSNPAGGITTNVAELIRFAACHMRDGAIGERRILTPESAQLMRQLHQTADYGRDWGLGWIVRQIDGLQIVEHGGTTNGFTARLITVPERQFAIAILTNGEYGAQAHSAIASTALEQILGLLEPPPAEPIPLDRDHWRRLTGTYSYPLADVTIALEDDGLVMHRTTHDPFSKLTTIRRPARLVPLSDTTYRVEEGELQGAVGEFILNSDGSIRFLRTGGRIAFPKES
jgi:CubicO group peptidase (beta-lactamase class C family)